VAAEADPRRTPIVQAVEAVRDGIVNISAQRVETRQAWPGMGPGLFPDLFGRPLGGPSVRRPVQSLGTGFLTDTAGTVLTNEHVISGTSDIRVRLADGREFSADVVGAAPDVDLAVLRLRTEGESLPAPLRFAREPVLIGEPAIAIGNPFGLDHSVSVGVVSARDRSFRVGDRTYAGVLQTDASINPGNSGGPLINVLGEVIGVSSAIFQDAQGIGFAIPADVAQRVVTELVSTGEVSRGWLGIELQKIDAEIAASMGRRSRDGALVTRVHDGSPADRVGIAAGDILTGLDQHRLREPGDIGALLSSFPPGAPLVLHGERSGETRTWRLEVAPYGPERVRGWFARLGLQIRPDGREWVLQGVRAGSPAAEIGFRPGDRIVAIDRVPVSDQAALEEQLLKERRRGYFQITLRRGRLMQTVGLRLPPPDASY
jgi:S1-C subfamily serine protease